MGGWAQREGEGGLDLELETCNLHGVLTIHHSCGCRDSCRSYNMRSTHSLCLLNTFYVPTQRTQLLQYLQLRSCNCVGCCVAAKRG